MRNIFALPDFLLLQLYRKARIYLLVTYLLLSLTIAYLCSNRIEGLEYALLLFVIVQGGVWISLKLKININIFTIPIGLIFLFFADLYSNKGAPVYIFMLMMYLYINVFIRYKFLRFYYLCFALLVTILMVYPDSSFEALLRIMVTYFVAAFTMFLLIDYLRKVERDLASRNQDLTDIFNSSPLPIMLIEYNGNISMMNDSCCELFGMQQDALQDKTLRDIFYFEKAKRADDLLKHFKRAIDENRTLRIEEEYKKRSGEVISISAEIKPLLLHQVKYILFVGQDVTKELRLKKEIQRTHKLYKTMAANIPNSAVYMFDRQLRFMLVEGGELHKDDFGKNNFAGKTLRESFSPDVANILEQHFKATLIGVESTIEINVKGKEYVYYFLPVRAENNQIMSGIALSVNITELKETKTEVSIKSKMIDAYAHKASHVVRRPVANLLGLAEILMNKNTTEDEKQVVVKFIYDSIKELDDNLKDAADELNK